MQVKKDEVWIGGIDKPFIASWDMITSGLGGLGLALIDHWERDEKPLSFDPKKLRPYADDWDQVVVLQVLRTQNIELPPQVKWAKKLEAELEAEPDAADDDDDDDAPVTTIPEVTITSDPPRPSTAVGGVVLIVVLVLVAKHYLR